jgi:hypothetical protein
MRHHGKMYRFMLLRLSVKGEDVLLENFLGEDGCMWESNKSLPMPFFVLTGMFECGSTNLEFWSPGVYKMLLGFETVSDLKAFMFR